MAKGNLGACLAVTLEHEGGYSDHPADPGGATNMGITIGRLSEVRGRKVSKAEVKALSLAEAKAIYDRYYWQPVHGDDLPHGVDLATFDFGVNSGPSRGVRYLQWTVGTKQDGVMGPKTLAAVLNTDGKKIVQTICARRLSFVQGLSTFKVFGRGWSRRIADVEANSVKMWLNKGKAMSEQARRELEAEAEKARDTSGKQDLGAGGAAGGGGAGVGGALLANAFDWLLLAGIVGLAVLAVLLAIKAKQNADRADAYEAAAAGA